MNNFELKNYNTERKVKKLILIKTGMISSKRVLEQERYKLYCIKNGDYSYTKREVSQNDIPIVIVFNSIKVFTKYVLQKGLLNNNRIIIEKSVEPNKVLTKKYENTVNNEPVVNLTESLS